MNWPLDQQKCLFLEVSWGLNVEIMSWLTVTVVDKAPPAFWPSLMQYPPHNISCSHVHYMRFIVGSNVIFFFYLTGADGNSAGGQLAGSQHYAEDGPTCLICSLATLQRQVYSRPHSQVIHYMHNLLGTVYIHVSVIPSSLFRFKHPSEGELCALAGKQMPKPNRRDRWESGDGMTQIRVPGEARHCLNHKSNVPLIYFLSYYFLLQSSCSTSVFLLSVTEKQTRPLFIFYNFFVWFLGDRTGRISLSRCPKTSTFTWRKLQSTLLTLLVKQTFFYLHHNDAVEVQTRLEHNCWLTTNPQCIYFICIFLQSSTIF